MNHFPINPHLRLCFWGTHPKIPAVLFAERPVPRLGWLAGSLSHARVLAVSYLISSSVSRFSPLFSPVSSQEAAAGATRTAPAGVVRPVGSVQGGDGRTGGEAAAGGSGP